MNVCVACGAVFDAAKELAEHYRGSHVSGTVRCRLCGLGVDSRNLPMHAAEVHSESAGLGEFQDSNGVESSLLKKAGEEEKARKRSRGPYRKSHAA